MPPRKIRREDVSISEVGAASEIARSSHRANSLAALAVILVLLAAGVWLGTKFVNFTGADSEFSAVYLSTGDLYFGDLQWFPKPHMKNPIFLQRGANQVALLPFKDVFWAPGEDLYLNPKEIIWWAKIRNDSQLVEAIRNPDRFREQNTVPVGEQPAVSTSTPTGAEEESQ